MSVNRVNRVQPIAPVNLHHRRKRPYVLYECEACGEPGRLVEVEGEAHLLCQECAEYAKQVREALSKDSLEWFAQVNPVLEKVFPWICALAAVFFTVHLFRAFLNGWLP